MSDSNQPAVTPYLTIKGGLDAIAFYQRAFGAELLSQEMDDDGRRVAALRISPKTWRHVNATDCNSAISRL